MTDINELCLVALQLYKPAEYGIGIDLDQFTALEMKEAQLEAHENLQLLSQHMHINPFHDVWLGSNKCGLL